MMEDVECDLCTVGTQHRCRICDKIVCVLKCSIQDPNSENEIHRVQKPGDKRCVQLDTYSCAICGKTFESKNNLYQHLKTPHESLNIRNSFDAEFECPTCEDKFLSPRDILGHMEQLHERS